MADTKTTTQNQWDRKELGALWKKQKQGTDEKYFSGTINLKSVGFDKDIQVVVFTNKSKKEDKHPDARIYLSEPKSGTSTGPATKKVAPPVEEANDLI